MFCNSVKCKVVFELINSFLDRKCCKMSSVNYFFATESKDTGLSVYKYLRGIKRKITMQIDRLVTSELIITTQLVNFKLSLTFYKRHIPFNRKVVHWVGTEFLQLNGFFMKYRGVLFALAKFCYF